MKEFSLQLMDKTKNRATAQHALRDDVLQTLNTEPANKQKKDEISDKIEVKEQVVNEKMKCLRYERKISNFNDLNPLTLNMEQIYKLPSDIQVTDNGEIK